MTAHELANKLLQQDDKPVTIFEYYGGNEGAYKEVLAFVTLIDEDGKPIIVLRTH